MPQGPQNDLDAQIALPDALTRQGVAAEPGVAPPECGARLARQGVPAAAKLLKTHRHPQVTRQQLLQLFGRQGPLLQSPGKEGQAFVIDTPGLWLQTAIQRGLADAGKRQHHGRKAVLAVGFVLKMEPAFLPGGVEQRQRAVAEEVEKSAGGKVFVVQLALGDLLGVDKGHGTRHAEQTHERGRDLNAVDRLGRADGQAVIGAPTYHQRFNLAGRKRERDGVAKAQRRRQQIPTRRAIAGQPTLQQPHRLKKLKAVRVVKELINQTSAVAPLRGGHLKSGCFERDEITVSCVKLLMCTYRPKKRSSTAAKRLKPVPTKLSSSTTSLTSVPRTKVANGSPSSQAVAGTNSIDARPSIW